MSNFDKYDDKNVNKLTHALIGQRIENIERK